MPPCHNLSLTITISSPSHTLHYLTFVPLHRALCPKMPNETLSRALHFTFIFVALRYLSLSCVFSNSSSIVFGYLPPIIYVCVCVCVCHMKGRVPWYPPSRIFVFHTSMSFGLAKSTLRLSSGRVRFISWDVKLLGEESSQLANSSQGYTQVTTCHQLISTVESSAPQLHLSQVSLSMTCAI
jgi:hypothetical protein